MAKKLQIILDIDNPTFRCGFFYFRCCRNEDLALFRGSGNSKIAPREAKVEGLQRNVGS
jgi:hypothetical protein